MSTLPPGCIVRYRICTEKSVLGFGKYADLPVGDIMKVDEEYIPWIYYNKAGVSFHARILEGYGLEPIEKPGANPDKFWDWKRARERRLSEQYTEEQRKIGRINLARKKKAGKRAALARAERETRFSKRQLQQMNHGNMKVK